jgi:hypothetical protein
MLIFTSSVLPLWFCTRCVSSVFYEGCKLKSIPRPSLHRASREVRSVTRIDVFLQYSHEGKIKEPNLAAEAGAGLLSAATSYARGDSMGALKSAMSIFKSATGGQKKANEYAKQTRTSPADVVSGAAIRS